MKSSALLFVIVLAVAVNSQAQAVQKKNSFLNSHAVKAQYHLASNEIKKANRSADSLTTEEKLMAMPFNNDLYYKINTPFKTARTHYLNTTQLKHKLLFRGINAAVGLWYTNKYDIDSFEGQWFYGGLQQPLNHQLPVNPGNSTLLRPITKQRDQF